MSKSITVQIGDLIFESKTEAKDYIRKVIREYPLGQRIGDTHDTFLRDLISLHPHSEEKIGCGIAYFTVDLDQKWKKTRHFVVHRTDGSFTDFSFISCIDGTKLRQDIYLALRCAVAEQVIDFKRTFPAPG